MKDLFEDACDIARDLLPLYADGCTSDITVKALRAHLVRCDNCRDYLNSIKKCKKNVFTAHIPESAPDYSDLLRKVKHRKVIRHTLVSILLVTSLAGNIILALTRGE